MLKLMTLATPRTVPIFSDITDKLSPVKFRTVNYQNPRNPQLGLFTNSANSSKILCWNFNIIVW